MPMCLPSLRTFTSSIRGHPFMTSTRHQVFNRPAYMSRTPSLWTSTCGQHEMHIALEMASTGLANLFQIACQYFKFVKQNTLSRPMYIIFYYIRYYLQ